ncbi:hypothetical protein KIV45_21015 [Janthinobacterium lividum]|nr:hypothetical protein KIV45_21015 [Janthinobacterium lividum]
MLAGKDININLSGDLTNSGTIAGRSVVKLTADNEAGVRSGIRTRSQPLPSEEGRGQIPS